MHLTCELRETPGGLPIAAYESAATLELADLEGALEVAGSTMRVTLAARQLDQELAAHMPALCAELFPGEEIPPRKHELFVVLPGVRRELVIKLRGDNAGWWAAMGSASGPSHGTPLRMLDRLQLDGVALPGALKNETPAAWAQRFLERQVAATVAEAGEADGAQ